MENYPGNFENPFSTPEVDKKKDESEKSKEKKKSPFSLSPEKRQDDAKKIAESLDKSSIFKTEKPPKETADAKPELKHLKESEPVTETEAPLENVGEREAREVTQELAAARREEVGTEMVSDDDPIAEETAAGIEAAETFLQKVETTGDMDEAYQETAEEFGFSTGEDSEELSAETVSDEPRELEEGEISLGHIETQETGGNPAAGDDEDVPRAGVAGGGSAGTGSGGGRGGNGGMGHGGSAGSGGHGGQSGGTSGPRRIYTGGPGTHGVARFNTVSPHLALYTEADMRHAENSGLLVGGILGYLIGRRRGRIKTEKRLLPIQKRLEKQVKTIQEQLQTREFEIRQLAAERVATTRVEQAARGVAPPERASKPIRRETRLGLEKPVRAEKLGRVIVKAEAAAAVAPELRKIVPEQIKTMSRQEVLQIGEKVTIEGTTLRHMYESHLLGEQGLRRVVTEYLRGHDVQQALKQELVEREIDFERDPMLRDKAYREMRQTRGGGSSGLQQLLEKAGVDATQNDQLTHVVKQLQAAQEESLRRESRQRKLVDTAMVTLIVILAAIITIILLSK